MFQEKNNRNIKESLLMILVIILSFFLILTHINNHFHILRMEFEHEVEISRMTWDFHFKLNDVQRSCGVNYAIKINYLVVDLSNKNTTQKTTVVKLPTHPSVLTVGKFQQFLLKSANDTIGPIDKMEMVTPLEEKDYSRTLSHWVRNPSDFQIRMHIAALNTKYIDALDMVNTKTEQILTEWTVTFIKT
ncbi:putative ORFan [Tupanvirus deep ocean]|uniref:ORFan n=2 Tax=Tupanvirus TaxID=2094720 RepID=A0AC62A9Q9_9VIRU|nr:putative ORFan [Tupanvirus deep ocean]QKU34521.1 putative ORFan [Tupanvirus deep ocean]